MNRRDFLRDAATTAVLAKIGGNANAAATPGAMSAGGRFRVSLDEDWRFHLGDLAQGEAPELDDARWQTLNVPHDWSILGPFAKDNPASHMGGYLPGGIGWYRKRLTLPPGSKGKSIEIEFDGVYMNSDVWLNGHHLGVRPYGYSSFAYDLTPFLRNGGADNVLAVRVDNSKQPNSRWYSGSGIYRHVWLNGTSALAVDHWGTAVTTPAVSRDSATVKLAIQLRNADGGRHKAEIATEIFTAEGTTVAKSRTSLNVDSATPSTELTFEVKGPRLWSPDDPAMYLARTSVFVNGKEIDSYDTSFGIRSIAFDPDNGFSLNGDPVKFRGVCMHHDLGALGAAFSDAAAERRLALLKDMGCNAIRMSHNPPAPQLLDMCDRMGFLVIDEAFDEWSVAKERTPFGYHLYFKQWAERDLRDMIRRDRNHPSIVLWSIGNEIPDKGRPSGVESCAMLTKIVHEADPTRPVTAAVNAIEVGNKSGYNQILDVVGYNGGGHSAFYYDSDHAAYPQRKMYGSEVPHTAGTRGVYLSDKNYCSSYDETFVDLTCEDSWKLTHDKKYLAGEFRWIGFDYLGEPIRHEAFHIPARIEDASWPARSNESGLFDMCGFPKDAAFYYKSQWTAKPMLHLFPHWSWTDAAQKPVRVWCYTNCDFVELFLNGASMGKKYVFPERASHLEWTVNFTPGVLKAVGWKSGKQVCEQQVRTAGAPAKIVLEPERTTLKARGHDVVYVRATIADAQGSIVLDAGHPVRFSVEGPAELIAVDNGDTMSHASFQGGQMAAFHGLCIAVLCGTGAAGKVTLRGAAVGLADGTAGLDAVSETGRSA